MKDEWGVGSGESLLLNFLPTSAFRGNKPGRW